MTNIPSSSSEAQGKAPKSEVRSRLSRLLKAGGIGAMALLADCATTSPKAPVQVEQVVKAGSETYKVKNAAMKTLGGLRAMSKLGIKSAELDAYEYEITQIGPLEFKIRYWEKGNDPEKTREIPFHEKNPNLAKLSGLRAAVGELDIKSTEFGEIYDYEVVPKGRHNWVISFAAKGKLVKARPAKKPEPRILDDKTVKHLKLATMTSQEVVKKFDAVEERYGNRENFNLFAMDIGQYRVELRILEGDLMMGNVKGTIDLPDNQLRKRAQQDARDAIESALDESGLLSKEERTRLKKVIDTIRVQVDKIGDVIDETTESGIDLEDIPSGKPDYLTKDEFQIIQHLNEARTNPSGFAGKHLRNKRSEAAIECYEEMINTKPMQALTPSKGLYKSALSWARKAGKKGATGHKNTERIWKYGGTGQIAENCAYGVYDPLRIVIQLLIDEDVPGRGHRKNILDPEFACVGVSNMPHKSYRINSVHDFSEGCKEIKK